MGAKRPIVASDLPSLREILRHKENAWFVRSDDPKALAEGIIAVVHDTPLVNTLTETAYREVQEYTWDKRAKNILTFLNRGNSC